MDILVGDGALFCFHKNRVWSLRTVGLLLGQESQVKCCVSPEACPGITCGKGIRSLKEQPRKLKAAHVRMKMRTINTHIRFHSFALFVSVLTTAYWDAYRCHHSLPTKKAHERLSCLSRITTVSSVVGSEYKSRPECPSFSFMVSLIFQIHESRGPS